MKLPEKRSVRYDSEFNEYTWYWNRILDYIKYLCETFGDERAKEDLLKFKEYIYKYATRSAHKGGYDCILEIERLNKGEDANEEYK